MPISTAPDAEALAGMIRTEIDQARNHDDVWRVQETDLQAMYNVPAHVVTGALAVLMAEGTVHRSGRFWLAVTD